MYWILSGVDEINESTDSRNKTIWGSTTNHGHDSALNISMFPPSYLLNMAYPFLKVAVTYALVMTFVMCI